jgi:hypothetical protein
VQFARLNYGEAKSAAGPVEDPVELIYNKFKRNMRCSRQFDGNWNTLRDYEARRKPEAQLKSING